jgi:hypothetical protein
VSADYTLPLWQTPPHELPFYDPGSGKTFDKVLQIRRPLEIYSNELQTYYYCDSNSVFIVDNYVGTYKISGHFSGCWRESFYYVDSVPTFFSGSYIGASTGWQVNINTIDSNLNSIALSDIIRSTWDLSYDGMDTDFTVGGTQNYYQLGFIHNGDNFLDLIEFGDWSSYVMPENDSILIPENETFLASGVYDFSGECTDVGLNYSLNFRDFDWQSPNITCGEDFTWSSSFFVAESGGGGKEYFLYNHETEEYISIILMGYPADSFSWFTSFQYPELNSERFAKVENSDEFPLRIKYTTPSVDFENVLFKMRSCDSAYSNCTDVLNNSLTFFDENKTGFFETEFDFSTVGNYYFTLELIDSELMTVYFSQKIKIESTSDTGVGVQTPFLPDKKDLGFLGNQIRDLFVPSYGYVPAMISMFKEDFSEKFVSIIIIKDSFISSFSNIGTTSLDNLPHITIYGANVAPLDLQFIDPYISQFRLFMSAGMYLVCAIFLIRKTATIFKS